METENHREIKSITANQEILIKKVMKSRKLKDSEYRELKKILDSQVATSYDAAIFINYILAVVNFRRTFLNGKHKAYKNCVFCKSRENIERYLDLTSGKKAWVCETCAINLDTSKIVSVKGFEPKEAAADLYKKYESKELTSSQEDLVCEHREQ